MTQKIKAVKVASQPTRTGGTLFAVWDERNTRYSGFLDELKTVRAGDTIEAEIQVDGNFNNITALRGIEKGESDPANTDPPAPPAPPATAWGHREEPPEVRTSIEAQAAVRAVATLLTGGIDIPAETRDAFFNLVNNWLRRTAGTSKPEEQGLKPQGENLPEENNSPAGAASPLARNMARARWKKETALAYFKNKYKASVMSGDSLATALARLSPEQLKDFETLMADFAAKAKP